MTNTLENTDFIGGLVTYIRSLSNDDSTIYDKSIKDNDDIDLYYPAKRLAIRIIKNTDNRSNDYHYDRFIKYYNDGLFVISVFEDLYNQNKTIINKILYRTIKPISCIDANDCIVKTVDPDVRKKFNDDNNIEHDADYCDYSYGLFYNDELVECISLKTINNNLINNKNNKHNKNNTNKNNNCNIFNINNIIFNNNNNNNNIINNNYYEIIRHSVKYDLNVNNGFSKLINHFINNHNPSLLIVYSDNNYYSNNIYKQAGFKLHSFGDINNDYYWCKSNDVVHSNSSVLSSLLLNNPHISENELMTDLGYHLIHCCGNSLWQLVPLNQNN